MTSMRSSCLECQVEGATIERLGQGILEHRNVVVEIHVTKLFSICLGLVFIVGVILKWCLVKLISDLNLETAT